MRVKRFLQESGGWRNADDFGREFGGYESSPGACSLEKQGRQIRGKNSFNNSLRNLQAIFLIVARPKQKKSTQIRSAEPQDQNVGAHALNEALSLEDVHGFCNLKNKKERRQAFDTYQKVCWIFTFLTGATHPPKHPPI